jgi:hypothetical protein
MFCIAFTFARISVPAILTGSNPGALILSVYSEYGCLSSSISRLHSSGGAASSIVSVCPDESVCIFSSVLSGTPVYEIEISARSTGNAFTEEVTLI